MMIAFMMIALWIAALLHFPTLTPIGIRPFGVLQLAPRQHELVSFEGAGSSEAKECRIVAWSYELPYVDPNVQQTVLTNIVTVPGDSGSALIDSTNNYSRSAASAPASYSPWIWADSVMRHHNLTLA
jgi:hypothetical protein